MNLGRFIKDSYVKKVSFNKAVLWKDKQISLSKTVTSQFKKRGTRSVVFLDEVKKEKWTASVDTLRKCAIFKQEGQETQFYFPIDAFKKIELVTEQMTPIEFFDSYECQCVAPTKCIQHV